jgi:hypothetical protein
MHLYKLLTYGRERGFENFINRKLIWPFLMELQFDNLNNSAFEWKGSMDRNSNDF